jgi:hypothetical protein
MERLIVLGFCVCRHDYRRCQWVLRGAIVLPERPALRRTDGSVDATPTGRRRYDGGTVSLSFSSVQERIHELLG